MNIISNRKKPVVTPLFESQQFQQVSQQQLQKIDTSKEELVLRNKSKQFNFECGAIMGRINMEINSKFGLYWHLKNTDSFDTFITSVENYIKCGGGNITESDRQKLLKQWEKEVLK